VVGHHPHLPQGLERYGRGLIAYSLGDFLFDLPRAGDGLDERRRRLTATHPILEVELGRAGVAAHRVHWLRRDGAGRYEPACAGGDFDPEREFEELCRVAADAAELRRRMRAVYRGQVKDLLYYTPRAFCRKIRAGGARHLGGFLWWLSTLRRRPKRRLLLQGLVSAAGGGRSS
jgi:hypothetical protein